jgi:hypothetical protein
MPPAAAAKPAAPSFVERLWNDVSGDVGAVTGFAKGAAEGLVGEGVPKERASQFEGGQPRFAGRMLGAGVHSVAEGLWEMAKAPGKMLTGEMQPGPEAEAAARGIALSTIGAGGGPRGALRTGIGDNTPIGGGRVEPAAPASPVPPGIQPPPLGGQAMPPQGPGIPIQPGGAAIPGRPIPTLPPGQQPPLLGGQALPPGQPGIPRGPTGATSAAAPIPTIPPGEQPLRPGGQALPPREPGTPAPPGGSAEPSALSAAIAENNPGKVDAAVTRRYRQAVKPSREGVKNAPAIAEQDQRILTAVDQIIGNRAGLRLTDAAGQELSGALPRSLLQFSQAVDQTKKALFARYDALARQAGDMGVQVDLAPVIAELRAIQRKPEVIDLHPDLIPQAEQLARNFEARGFYTPGAAQDAIENLNKMLQAFYKNPTAETVSRGTMLAPIARTLRDQLDSAIEGSAGAGYQALRHQYGALRSVEKDVAAAVQREANKIPGGISGTLADIAAAESFIHGVITLSPGMIARAGGIRAARNAVKYLNDPNRAIERMFARRVASQTPSPPFGQSLDPFLDPAARAGAIVTGDEAGAGGVGRPLRSSIGGP